MDKPRKRIFVCSPYRPRSDDPEERKAEMESNLLKARQACRMAAEFDAIPIAPHLYFTQFLDDTTEEERAVGIAMGLALLEKCNELWVFGDTITEGMAREVSRATRLGIPVRIVHSLDLSEKDVAELLGIFHEMRASGIRPPYHANITDRKRGSKDEP